MYAIEICSVIQLFNELTINIQYPEEVKKFLYNVTRAENIIFFFY